MDRLRSFMFEHVYLGGPARREQERVARVIRALFDHFMGNPALVPGDGEDDDQATRVTDYLAGMTDRFCIKAFEDIAVPREFRY